MQPIERWSRPAMGLTHPDETRGGGSGGGLASPVKCVVSSLSMWALKRPTAGPHKLHR